MLVKSFVFNYFIPAADLDLEVIEAFLKEGMLMRDFSHQNVLTLLGVTVDEYGTPMVVLPLMVNGDLRKYLKLPTKVNIHSYGSATGICSTGI